MTHLARIEPDLLFPDDPPILHKSTLINELLDRLARRGYEGFGYTDAKLIEKLEAENKITHINNGLYQINVSKE